MPLCARGRIVNACVGFAAAIDQTEFAIADDDVLRRLLRQESTVEARLAAFADGAALTAFQKL